MATKAEKKRQQNFKQKLKEMEQNMANPTPTQVYQMENYCVYQILYINDAACNACKFLGDELKTIPYKGNGAQKIYNAMMKRVDAYWEFINMTKIDKYALASLFGEMDEYIDDRVSEIRKALDGVFAKYGITQHHWLASCETALILCDYAVQIARSYISRLAKVSKNAKYLIGLNINGIYQVIRDFCDFVGEIHTERKNIDLNKEPEVETAFRHLNKAFINADNFSNAVEVADKENEKENRIKLM